ncbi:MAG: TRAP transporter TatT component family protein [Vicinamibacterales bacterium]
MISCIVLVLYLSGSPPLPPPALPQQGQADALYAQRADLAKARRAAELWDQQLRRNGADFDAAWKLARARFWLGASARENERKTFLDQGIAAGRIAVTQKPNRPEGHFWIAANMGSLAESFGLRQGLKYRGDIRDELLTVLKLDPAFQQGSADRALGRWYLKVPGLFGGSKKKSEEHLRRSLTYNQNSISSRFFLAETLLEMDRKTEALAELRRVGELQPDPDWIPEDLEFKSKAQRLLTTLLQRR